MTSVSRRSFGLIAGGIAFGTSCLRLVAQEEKKTDETGPVESPFERDYAPPSFKPSWKKPQINRSMAQDFVIFGHSDLDKLTMLLDREPGLINASIDRKSVV